MTGSHRRQPTRARHGGWSPRQTSSMAVESQSEVTVVEASADIGGAPEVVEPAADIGGAPDVVEPAADIGGAPEVVER